MNENTSFLGRGWSFPPSFTRSQNGVEMTSDEEDIQKSLAILLSTNLGERVMQPTYGCNLTALLYEPLSTTLKTQIQDLVKTAILYHEPRIALNEVTLDLDDELDGLVQINVDYTIKTTNSRSNYVYPFYLKEGTNVNL